MISNAVVLIDQAIELGRLKIYGSPMTPLYGAAFGKFSGADRMRHWARIPDDVDLLITHGPPKGVLDRPPDQAGDMGDPELTARISQLSFLRLHCFGHVHGGHGTLEENGIPGKILSKTSRFKAVHPCGQACVNSLIYSVYVPPCSIEKGDFVISIRSSAPSFQ